MTGSMPIFPKLLSPAAQLPKRALLRPYDDSAERMKVVGVSRLIRELARLCFDDEAQGVLCSPVVQTRAVPAGAHLS